jgi:DNA polymerase I-like protein with 3'-5' exonuclease and polymerase domains
MADSDSYPPEGACLAYLDTETTGLDPRAARLVLVGFAADDRDVAVLRHPEQGEQIRAWLNLEATFCGHNIGFDLHFLECAGYVIPDPARWSDTVLVAHTAGERMPGQTALRRLTGKLIEAGKLPADTLEPEHAINGWLRTARRIARKSGSRRPEKGDAPRELLGPYLAADIVSTRAVMGHYGAAVDGQAPVLELERRCIPAIYAAERLGVPIDLDAARELRDRTETSVADLRARLFELAGRPFNPNAARQIETALAARGVSLSAVPRTSRADMPMFTADTLALIDDELARALLEYRNEKKLHDYVVNLWRHAHGDRLYGTFRQVGTETGRMSSSSPNMQNIPRSDLRVRYLICAGEGKTLVGADLDSVELRVLACYAPGGALERAFADGIDLHQQTADACGVDRDGGKRLNYLTIYGGGASRVAGILECSIRETKATLNRWYRLYPEVTRLKRTLAERVIERGYLETVSGRRHYFEEPNHMLLNRLISGTCADLFKAAAIELHDAGVPIVLYVHDEVVAEVAEDRAHDTGRILEQALTRGAGRTGVQIGGLVADVTVARRWSDFKQPGYAP